MVIRRTQGLLVLASMLLLIGCDFAGQAAIVNVRSAGGLAYDISGEGPLVVLIHGSNLDRRMWQGEVAWLQEDRRVLRYDLRGQGKSDFPEEAFSNHKDLLALVDEIGEQQVTLIGLSSGAQIAVDVALEAPGRVRQMVLVSPSLNGYVPEQMPPFIADLVAALQARDFARVNEVLLASSIMSVPPGHADLVRTMVEDSQRMWTIPYTLVEQVSPPAIERLEKIHASTLILTGEDDLKAVHDQSLLLEERLPSAKSITITGGGHLLNMTSPDGFRKAVGQFLGLPE